MEVFNSSISLTELLLSTAFHLGQTTLSTVSDVAETYVHTVDSIFGCTETSRAISEIVKLVRQEFKDSSEHDGEVGMKDIIAGLTCFAILQYRTRARFDQAFAGDLIWDVVVDADISTGSATTDEETAAREKTGDLIPTEETGREMIPESLLEKLPQNAEISVSSTSTTTRQTTIEVVGTSPPEFTPPPGAMIISENFHNDDGRQRYTIVYETVTAFQTSRRLKREEGGDVEMVDECDVTPVPQQQVFEIEDDDVTMAGVGKERKRTWMRGYGKPVGSESDDAQPPVPKKSRSQNQKIVEANKPKKRTSTVTDKKIAERELREKEREKERVKERVKEVNEREREREREREKEKEREKHKSKKSKEKGSKDPKDPKEKMGRLRKVLQPSPTINKDKKTRLSVDPPETTSPRRTRSTSNCTSLQTSPIRSRRQSVTSRPASPESRYRTRHHHRTASFTSTTSETFSTRHNPGLTIADMASASSPVSVYSYNGEPTSRPPSAGVRHAPSIYTMHTSHSTSSLQLLYSPPTQSQPGSYFPSSPHLLHNVRKYIRFAAASYGAQFMRFLLGSAFSPLTVSERAHHLEHQAFSFHTSLPVDTILLSSHYDPSGGFDSAGHTGTGRPLVHFVCVDHDAASIVVTCRGTLGLEDVLTDLSCEYTSLPLRNSTYRVHKGMFNSAVLLLRSRLLRTLADALNNYPTYGLVLTGHSLGGGVAALVAILISAPDNTGNFLTSHHALPAGRRVHCYAYGPPAAVCEPLRRNTRSLITTIVNGLDVVPCLSIGMVRDFHSVALSFREDTSGVLSEIRRRFLSGFWAAKNKEEQEFSWELAVLKTLRAGMDAEKLVPPGEVWACRRSEKEGKVRVTAGVVGSVEDRFGEVRLARGCFGDHSPAEYERTLEALCRGVCGEEGK